MSKFLLDESAEARIKTFLLDNGYDARRIGQDYPQSLPDEEVLAIARDEARILITNDRDFGELIFRQHLPHAGVIYLRFPDDATAALKIAALTQLLTTHRADLGKYIVVGPGGIRVRS